MESIKIKRVRSSYSGPLVEKNEKGDWIDVFAAKDVPLGRRKHVMIPLGFACKLPEGYEALLVVRSSTFKKWGIIQTNAPGVIDNAYCGDGDEWMLSAFVPGNYFPDFIPEGTKIAQMRIQKNQPTIAFEYVETLGGEDRGGFGSTDEEVLSNET